MSAQTVWHWKVPVDDSLHELDMPTDARIVHVAIGPTTPLNYISLWAVVEERETYRHRTFTVTGTGHVTGDGWTYVGTALDLEFPLVWHLWEIT